MHNCNGLCVSHACRMVLYAAPSCHAAHTGIGLGIARRLAQEGAHVMISSRKAKNVEDTVAALLEEGFDVKGVACHVGSLEQVQRLIQVHAALASSIRNGHLLHGLSTVPSKRMHGCMRPCSIALMEGGLGCIQLIAYQGQAMAMAVCCDTSAVC